MSSAPHQLLPPPPPQRTAAVQALHRLIDELADLEPAALHSLHLLTYRVCEAARAREGGA
jgi:hypothetical protein